METITRLRPNATVRVSCVRCDDVYVITDRQRRRKLSEGRPHICSLCRAVRAPKPTPAYYNYWLQRYSMEEIRAMAAAIWG